MSKKGKRNAIKNSNEHVYSKGPLYRVQSDFDVTVTGQMASFYKGREKEIIARYIHEAWTLEKQINLPEESVYNVWFNIDSDELQNQFLKHVFRHNGYNPYTDKLPTEDMPEELKTEVVNIQHFLKENYRKKICFKDETCRLISIYYHEPIRVRMQTYLQRADEIIMSRYHFVGMWFRDGDMAEKTYMVLNKKHPGDWTHARNCVYTKSSAYGGYFLSEETIAELWKEALQV